MSVEFLRTLTLAQVGEILGISEGEVIQLCIHSHLQTTQVENGETKQIEEVVRLSSLEGYISNLAATAIKKANTESEFNTSRLTIFMTDVKAQVFFCQTPEELVTRWKKMVKCILPN